MDPPPARASGKSGEGFMYLKRVSDFIGFLGLHQHKLEDVLSHLVHRVLVDIQVTSIFILGLNEANNVELVGQFGCNQEMWKGFPKNVSIFDKYPATEAMRTRKTSWINSLPDWGQEYPLLKDFQFDGPEKTSISMTIERCGTPVAVVGFYALEVVEVDGEIDSFLGTIANVLSLYFFSDKEIVEPTNNQISRSTALNNRSRDESLTERQLLILKLISENRTNISISELLGYSESTIRQETIKIYAKLGCNGREEASRIYLASSKEEVLA
jgi:DNA-binding CsgD family transcriptional regulator